MATRSDSGRLRTVFLLSENPWEERKEERNTVSGRERASLKCEAANRRYRSSSDARATRGLRLARWPLVCYARRHPCSSTCCAFFPTVRASLRQWQRRHFS